MTASGLQQLPAVCLRGLARVLVAVYFRRIECFHPERVPASGPVILAPNHPASVTDAMVLAGVLSRRVYFVGTVQLFRWRPLGWLLRQCGILPINRLKDDPRAMRSVMDTFEACYRVLEGGGALGIFPEGVTYDDDQLRPVKSGVARIALELEDRHAGQLGLVIVPVGLSYAAKERYRSEMLVHFGEPMAVGARWAAGAANRKEAIRELTASLEQQLQSLIVHLPALELSRVVEATRRLYLDRLVVARRLVGEPLTPQAEALVVTQALGAAVTRIRQRDPERFGEFVRQLDRYEARLRRLRISDQMVAWFGSDRKWGWRAACWAALGLAGLPVAAYGWLHRLLPVLVVEWATRRWTVPATRKAQTAVAVMLAGLVAFTLFYALYVGAVHALFGWPASGLYALSLPGSGLVAHYYGRGLARFAAATRASWVMLRAPWARRGLLRQRQALVDAIEAARRVLRDERVRAAGQASEGDASIELASGDGSGSDARHEA